MQVVSSMMFLGRPLDYAMRPGAALSTQFLKKRNHAYSMSSRQEHQLSEKYRECNQKYEKILKILKAPHNKGFGLFASKDFVVGDLVMASRPVDVTTLRGSHTVQIDWDRHVIMDLPAVLINHSCDANVGIRNNNISAYDFRAIRPIIEGEELTFDYETSEWEISIPFPCDCGSVNCRGTLRGFKSSGKIIRKQYGENYADYLKREEEEIRNESRIEKN